MDEDGLSGGSTDEAIKKTAKISYVQLVSRDTAALRWLCLTIFSVDNSYHTNAQTDKP